MAMKLTEERNLVYVNGFDDPAVIAGAGTIGVELLQQVPNLDAVLIPVGGAGLIAGVSLAIKTLSPHTQVIGVEAVNCASFTAAVRAGEPTALAADTPEIPLQPTLADGLAVPKVGSNAFQVAKHYVDHIITVPDSLVALAILRLLEEEKIVVEGGGATALAPLLMLADDYVYRNYQTPPEIEALRGKRVCVLLCGGNIDITVLASVIDRGLAADGRLVQFDVEVSDHPGGLQSLTTAIAEEGASVKEISHERAFCDTSMGTVNIRVVSETRNKAHSRRLVQSLEAKGYKVDLNRFSRHVVLQRGESGEDLDEANPILSTLVANTVEKRSKR